MSELVAHQMKFVMISPQSIESWIVQLQEKRKDEEQIDCMITANHSSDYIRDERQNLTTSETSLK